MTGRPQQQPGAGGSRNPRPSGGSSVDLRASIIIAAARDSSLSGSWPRCSPTAAALCRCWPPAMPAPAARRGGVERPRASLADPPSISGPAASAWRPMTAACRAHDRAALAARWPWPPPRGAAHHNHKPSQTTAAHHARHTPYHLLPLPLKRPLKKVFY